MRQSGSLLIMSSMYFLFSILWLYAFMLQFASLIILYVFFFLAKGRVFLQFWRYTGFIQSILLAAEFGLSPIFF